LSPSGEKKVRGWLPISAQEETWRPLERVDWPYEGMSGHG